jgi:hypothetical protein
MEETSTSWYAWVLMKTHVYLLLRTGLIPLSSLMRRLLTGYALQFNKRCRGSGHLFQNRYKSFLAHIAFDTLRLKGIEIADRLNLTPSAVSRLATKGRTDRSLAEIERRLFERNR